MGWVLKFIKNPKLGMYVKLVWLIAGALSLTTMEWAADSNEAKYIAALFFGYTSNRVWGKDKPSKEVA